ncbi:MAG: S41 family peptidase [Elusimicrobiales bacterium]
MDKLVIGLAIFAVSATAHAEVLRINDTDKNIFRVIYELSADSAKDKTAAYISSLWKENWPKAELVAGETAHTSMIQERSRNNFVLYSVFGEKSQFLNQMGDSLNLHVYSSSVSIGGEIYQCANPRLIFAWKEEMYNGYATVYAAKSNAQLIGMDKLPQENNYSYLLFDGDKLMMRGSYDDLYNFSKNAVSVSEAGEDMNQFFSDLESIHPNLLANISADNYLKLKRQTADEIAKKGGGTGTISVKDLAYILYYAAAQFKDGHTSLQALGMFGSAEKLAGGEKIFPPFVTRFVNGKFMVSEAADKTITGRALVAVNNIPFAGFITPILDRCSAETLSFRASRFQDAQDFWWAFSRLLADTNEFEITVDNADGKLIKKTAHTIDAKAFGLLYSASRNPSDHSNTRVEFLDGGKIAHFIYPSFDYTDAEMQTIDRIFRDIKNNGSKELIIDIRNNGGGSSDMGIFILKYISPEKLRAFSGAQVKISQQAIEQYGYYGKYKQMIGLVTDSKNDNDDEESGVSPKIPDAFFKGKTYLLIDNGTFSSATDFATIFRDYSLGDIIGYETGGVAASFGDVISRRLNNSWIRFGVSYKKFYPPKPRPGDDTHGVLPDIPVTDKILGEFKSSSDPVLDFTIQLLKTRRMAHK